MQIFTFLPVLAVVTAVSFDAEALQPLSAFVTSARSRNVDNREAAAVTRQREAEVDVARAAYLPSFSARGLYTHNQYAVSILLPFGVDPKPIVITPKNQIDGFLTLNVPIVDLGALARFRAARATSEATFATEHATAFGVEGQVATAYYRVVGAGALREAARANLGVAESSAALARERRTSGAAAEIDVQRAAADVARATQELAEAELDATLAARSLETVTGLAPESVTEYVPDDLAPPPPLELLAQELSSLPENRAAEAAERAAYEARSAATFAALPVLSVAAEERITNARGFVGKNAFYALTANLTWNLDAAVVARVKVQRAGAEQAAIVAERTRRRTLDTLFEAWHRVQTAIARSAAARAQEAATRLALVLARERYGLGASTQLELLQAQRDAFASSVARIQSDADLALSRAHLRIGAGCSLTAGLR